MTPFALVEDLGDVSDEVGAYRALVSASHAIVASLGWDPRQSERTALVEGSRVAFLRALNVTAVAVAADGIPVATTDYLWTTTGKVTLLRAPHRWASALAITYTAGYPPEEIDDLLASACIEAARRRIDSRGGLKSKTWTLGAESEAETYDLAYDLSSDPSLSRFALPPAVA